MPVAISHTISELSHAAISHAIMISHSYPAHTIRVACDIALCDISEISESYAISLCDIAMPYFQVVQHIACDTSIIESHETHDIAFNAISHAINFLSHLALATIQTRMEV